MKLPTELFPNDLILVWNQTVKRFRSCCPFENRRVVKTGMELMAIQTSIVIRNPIAYDVLLLRKNASRNEPLMWNIILSFATFASRHHQTRQRKRPSMTLRHQQKKTSPIWGHKRLNKQWLGSLASDLTTKTVTERNPKTDLDAPDTPSTCPVVVPARTFEHPFLGMEPERLYPPYADVLLQPIVAVYYIQGVFKVVSPTTT